MDTITSFTGSNRFLSNFWPAWVKAADGTEFETVEQAYQYEKFLDGWQTHEEPRTQIKASKTPGQAKRIADRYKHSLPADWHERKVHVMRRLLAQKFVARSLLAQQLDATGNAELIEGNTWGDTFFGVCHEVGQNWLGRLLMQIRHENRTA